MSKIKEITVGENKVRLTLLKSEFVPIIGTKRLLNVNADDEDVDFNVDTEVSNYTSYSLMNIDDLNGFGYSYFEKVFKDDLVNYIKQDKRFEHYKNHYSTNYNLIIIKDGLTDEELLFIY